MYGKTHTDEVKNTISMKAKDKNKATEKLFVHSDIYENYFKNCVDKIK